MPRVQVGYEPRAEALQTVAAPNIQTEQARFDPNANKAFQLASVFAKAQPALDKFNEDIAADKRRKEILDTMRIPAFVEQAKRESADGTISATQTGASPPEASEVVRARLEDAKGSEWAKTLVQPLIEKVMGNAQYIEDADARRTFINEEKQKIFAQIPQDRLFFKSGAVTTIEKELNQYENGWQRQTAAHHTEVQTKDFKGKVVEAMKSADPSAALLGLDNTWKTSSSLGNEARNKLVVETVTQQAIGERNVALLEKIPERFLNAETKAALSKTRAQITEMRWGDYSKERQLQAGMREDNVRAGKAEIVRQAAANNDIDPAKYTSDPELYQFATTMREAPRRPAAESTANLQRVRQSILNRATTEGVDTNKLIDEAMRNSYLNPGDRNKLVEEIPRLVEGTIAMNDDMVKSAYNTRIGASLEEAAKNPMVVLSPTLRSRTVNLFDQTVRNSFSAYYEENGKWPTGRAKQDIVDSAVDRTEAFMQQQLQGSKGQGAAPQAPAAVAPKPAAAAPVKITSDAEFNNLKSGTRFVGPDGITRTKP